MLDRTAYIPGTMTLARVWGSAPEPGASLEAWLAYYEANCPGGEFNDSLALWAFTEHLSAIDQRPLTPT